MAQNKLSDVVWDCTYPLVFLPKYRCKIFNHEVKIAVRDEIRNICMWLKLQLREGKVSKDHVHLCLSIPPKHALSDIIGTIKGKTAIRMFNRFPELKWKYWGCHFWSRGYFVSRYK